MSLKYEPSSEPLHMTGNLPGEPLTALDVRIYGFRVYGFTTSGLRLRVYRFMVSLRLDNSLV